MGVRYVPDLAFSEATALVLIGVLIGRVHLHGKIGARVDKFDEYGENLMLLSGFTEYFGITLVQFYQVETFEKSFVHLGRATGKQREFPAFRDGVGIGSLAPKLFERGAAPYVVLDDGFQFKRFKFHDPSVCFGTRLRGRTIITY